MSEPHVILVPLPIFLVREGKAEAKKLWERPRKNLADKSYDILTTSDNIFDLK